MLADVSMLKHGVFLPLALSECTTSVASTLQNGTASAALSGLRAAAAACSCAITSAPRTITLMGGVCSFWLCNHPHQVQK